MAHLLREERPKWLEVMQFLADHGALAGPGCRISRDDFAAAVGLDPKNLSQYTKKMEQHGVLSIRRTTVDGSFASPRGFNIYTLHCSPARWRDSLGPVVIAERRRRVTEHQTVMNRATARELKRKRLVAKLDELGPDPKAPTPRPARASSPRAATPTAAPEPSFAPEEAAEIYDRYADPSVDLSGW